MSNFLFTKMFPKSKMAHIKIMQRYSIFAENADSSCR
jgi:hypothetical protein